LIAHQIANVNTDNKREEFERGKNKTEDNIISEINKKEDNMM